MFTYLVLTNLNYYFMSKYLFLIILISKPVIQII